MSSKKNRVISEPLPIDMIDKNDFQFKRAEVTGTSIDDQGIAQASVVWHKSQT